MDPDGIQHDADVYGAVLCLPRRTIRTETSVALVCSGFHRRFDPASVLPEFDGNARSASHRWDRFWYVLSDVDILCADEPANALCHLCHWCLLDRHPGGHKSRSTTRSLVHKS